MKNVKLEQVGELLQAIYDTETHFKLEWMWDGGFDFAFGCMRVYDKHPEEVRKLFAEIDETKIEQVASLILMEYEMNYSLIDSKGNLNSMGLFVQKLK